MTDQVLKGESSLADEIVQILRSRIINGEYAIGEKLVENKIAKENTISVRGAQTADIIPKGGAVDEAITALVVLGYTEGEAASALSGLDPALPVEELIKKRDGLS